MPEGMTNTGAPPQGGATPPMPGQPPQEQPAGGAGGATMPTPNRGIEAAALARAAVHLQALGMIAGVLPAGSEAAIAFREGLNKMVKFMPPGGVSEGVKMSEAQRSLMQQRQMGPQVAAMRAAQPAGQPPQPAQPPAQLQAA
jgi:hypothetical protein